MSFDGWYLGEPPSDAPAGFLRVQEAILDLCACGCGKPLTGQQKRFASEACSRAWFETARPRILNASAGAPREGTILAALLGLLADGDWHDLMSLSAELKALPCSVSARIREARSKGFRVERDLKRGNVARPHRYRLRLQTGAEA
jgi:hypothetical protein